MAVEMKPCKNCGREIVRYSEKCSHFLCRLVFNILVLYFHTCAKAASNCIKWDSHTVHRRAKSRQVSPDRDKRMLKGGVG